MLKNVKYIGIFRRNLRPFFDITLEPPTENGFLFIQCNITRSCSHRGHAVIVKGLY